jgi:hypothetical protein
VSPTPTTQAVLLQLPSRSFLWTLPSRTGGSHLVNECPTTQGIGESISYNLNAAPWSTVPTDPEVYVYDASANYASVKATVMPAGTPSVSGSVITLPPLTNLSDGRLYRVAMIWDSWQQTWWAYCDIRGER